MSEEKKSYSIEAQLKISHVTPVGEIFLTGFDVEEGINYEIPIPQHFALYTESEPDWKPGDAAKLTITGHKAR